MKRILAIAVGLNPDSGARSVWQNIIGNQQVPVRPYVKGLIDGLSDLGLRPGQDFQIDYATCEPRGFAQFIKGTIGDTAPDAMFAMSTTAAKAAMAASKTIPIVFPSISDPVEDGVVKSCPAPGKNATGIQAMRRQTADECLELFKATVPSLRTILGMHKPNYGPATRAYKSIRQAAKRAGVTFTPLIVRSHKDIVSILSAMSPVVGKKGPEQGVLILPDDLALSAWPKITAIARDRKIPNFFPVTDWVRNTTPSALAGFGIPQYACGKAAAAYMQKVLNGVDPKALPVKRAGGFEWAVNAKLALEMGITIPNSVLSAADRVI
jgi:putative ABC transport system substrate-binding protein